MRRRRLNSSVDVDRYLNIKSMNGDNTKYAYDLEITNENSRSIYAVSNVYGWTYKVDKNTTAVYLDGKKIADDCVYSIDEYFDIERPVNSSRRKLNSAVGTQFDEKAFDKYLNSLVEDCVEYASEHGDPVQIIEHMYPGYNWEWACEGTDPAWDKLRKDLQNALYNYIKYQYLAYKNENEEDL